MKAELQYDAFLEQEFRNAPKELTSDIYHYTTSSVAIAGILPNRSIRMSPFHGTNDLWESRPIFPSLEGEFSRSDVSADEQFAIWSDIDRFIRGHSKVACFTQDWKMPESVLRPEALRGWRHLSMWAHYGGSHTGVCLRFDRGRLVSAFDASRGDAMHQFYGEVDYRNADYGLGPRGVSLRQIEEFGVDAVALDYARLNRNEIFFRKHADWANESEFRLVRTDLSSEPYYFDFKDSLTGIVLGDDFPIGQIPALRKMLEDYPNVEVLKASFHNRTFGIFPLEDASGPEAEPPPRPRVMSTIKPRRSGNLIERLKALVGEGE